ncbi:CsgG/HfaB family protein [Cyclobacteriaceae bacterium]|nr:CsgG/HfaB family protein [Cyclobacteriaceae bacterium]
MRYILLALSAIIFFACTGSKKMVKKGRQLEEAGMYKDASDFYYKGLIRNENNVDAIIGLKQTGQKVLDDILQGFYKAYSFEEYGDAVYSYIEARAYYEKLEKVKVKLDFPPYYPKYYEESKKVYLAERYDEAMDLMKAESYVKAETVFKEIVTIQPDYKDAGQLSKVAYIEPYYKAGLTAMDEEHYRDAYYQFNEVIIVSKTYKDAFDLRQECRDLAIFTIAFVPYKNENKYKNYSAKINTSVLADLGKKNNPFITIVDRQNTDKLIEEQKMALQGIVDNNSAAQAGLLLGVKAVYFGQVTSGSKSTGQLKSSKKECFERVVTRRYNSSTQKYYTTTSYRRRSYTLYTQSISVVLSYNYQLVSSETGEILLSGSFQEEKKDDIKYATTSGGTKNLYPTKSPSVWGNEKKEFDALFKARKTVKSPEILFKEIYNKISNDVTGNILKYEASRI